MLRGKAGVDRGQSTVTRLLGKAEGGDRAALHELFTLLYKELTELAHRHRQRWHGDHTLNTTALVHEAYLKLVGKARIGAEGRAHFLALAAKAMRHILCNYARERRAQKRGGGLERLPFDELKAPPVQVVFSEEKSDTLVALDDALQQLERLHPRQSKVVECRFFGGLTIEETAAAMGISQRTVQRDWAVAQAWLYREMRFHV